jgi:branched-chain amino acid transport system permease protein
MTETAYGILTALVAGILLGGLYVIVAQGFSLVFGVMKLINVAHGDLVILSSYLALALTGALGIDPFATLVIIIPVMFFLGFALQKYLLNRTALISADAPIIICIGVSLILSNLFQLIWSPLSRGVVAPYSIAHFSIGGLIIPVVYFLDFIIAIVVVFILHQFLRRTYLGRAIIGASQDRRAAMLMGVNTSQIYAFAFAIAMICAAVGGILQGLTFPFTPTSGTPLLIIAFGVVILGGLGSMVGTFIGGIIFGIAQCLGGYFFGVASQMFVAYIMVLVVLTVRPQGVFGR